MGYATAVVGRRCRGEVEVFPAGVSSPILGAAARGCRQRGSDDGARLWKLVVFRSSSL